MADYAFPKSNRLLTSKEYSPVFDNARFKAGNSHFLMLAIPNQLGHPRLGLVIAKKNIRHAVHRNRIKRLLREQFRLHEQLPAIDIVVLTRPKIGELENKVLITSCNKLFGKLTHKEKQQHSA